MLQSNSIQRLNNLTWWINSTAVNDNIFEILKYSPQIITNKWKHIQSKIESDIDNIWIDWIINYFLETWIYIHILYLDSKELYNKLKEKVSSFNVQEQKRLLFNNHPFIEKLRKTNKWKEFLFEVFETSSEKNKIPPYFQVTLMTADEERYFDIIKNDSILIEKILKSFSRSYFKPIKRKLKERI